MSLDMFIFPNVWLIFVIFYSIALITVKDLIISIQFLQQLCDVQEEGKDM